MGFLIIAISVSNVYLIMNGQKVPAYFDFEAIMIEYSAKIDLGGLPAEIRDLIKVPEQPPIKLVSKEILNGTTNFMLHIFIMSFFLNAGAHLAGIGVKMLRPNVVKISHEEVAKNLQA